ncbi:MAG: hypothetical protein QW091_02305 [Candidatus Micrarchaeaceae archaeon]
MTEVSAEILFDKLSAEKSTGELNPLTADFYYKAEQYIALLANTDKSSVEVVNAQKMLSQLKEKRKQKILVYLAFGKPLPKPIPEEEETLYNEILQILSNSADVKTTRLKILADLPEIMTPEGKKLGPFKNGEVIEVTDVKDASFIVNNKIGEKV